jgi:hypothetical protein
MEVSKLCIDPKEEPAAEVPGSPEPENSSRKRMSFPNEALMEMSRWIGEHLSDPFLSREEETFFMVKYGITRKQVKTAFNNRRQRLAVPFRSRTLQQRQAYATARVTPMAPPTLVQVQPVYWGPPLFVR